MIGKYLGAQVKNAKDGSTYSMEVFNVGGEDIPMKRGKYFKGVLASGVTYNITTWQGEGMNTIFINGVSAVDTASGLQATQKPAPAVKQNVQPDKPARFEDKDKMTKEDWAKKDDNIKWLACIKASSEFNAHRPDKTLFNVLDDARLLFHALTTQPVSSGEEVLNSAVSSYSNNTENVEVPF